ncbi:AAA family ATPase [Pricia sp. S334]|uniref:AAA family ATPase n=1 Tax=Pricia mediterranea TaxID=3076079 RepID=A0ABU3L2K6_9FLAO|nr:AAA family ATPase [Pricia sp. S334]MDT7827976.1 AAA family ATPase [Pricia sp. S334]
MKILNIHFKNINSLKGTHQVDFTEAPFNRSTLFAITGPTGSGKSTLLDVISLALFNQTPRLGKISRKEILAKGALLTRNQKEAAASVTYRCKAGVFTSSWRISTNRNHQLRDYEMEIADEVGTLLDLKKSQVPTHNEKLIGLNYEQFIKSVVLAQGEFAQFLKAKKDERGALLEKITGTGIYRDIGRKTYERFKTEIRKIERQQDEIQTHHSELLEDGILKEFTAAFRTKKETIGSLEVQIKRLEKQVELKERLAKTEKEIDSEREKQSLEKKKMATFQEQSGAQLDQHEKVRPVADELRSWSSLQEALASRDKQLEKLAQHQGNNQKAVAILLREVSDYIGKQTDSENLVRDINDFSDTVRELQKLRDTKLKEHANIESIIKEQARETAFNYNKKANNLETLHQLKSTSEKHLAELLKFTGIADIGNLAHHREALSAQIDRSQQLEKIGIVFEQKKQNLDQYMGEVERIKLQRKALPKDIELAQAKAKGFEKESEALQVRLALQRLRASLEEHRNKLKKNEPCPLCGSLEHPFAQHLPQDQTSEKEIKALGKEFEKWNAQAIAKISELGSLNEREDELRPKMEVLSKEIEKLGAEETKLSEGLRLPPYSSWEHYTRTCQEKLEALTHLEQENKMLIKYKQLRPNLEKLGRILEAGIKTKDTLKAKYKGKDINADSQQLLTKWTELNKEERLLQQSLSDIKTERKTRIEEIAVLEGLLNRSVSLKSFDTIADARKALLDEKTLDRLQSQKSGIEKELDRLDTSLALLQKQFDTDKRSDVPQTQEKLQEDHDIKREKLQSTREEKAELERQLVNHREKTEKIANLKQQIATEEKQIKRWKLLNELIGDAQGKRFNDFAQDLTLRHLVALANARLESLSDRYRLDIPTEEEDDGLIILDGHMGGQRRSVKTLSGGETFLLSLSMALALSDLASSNVEINSLFIDEGFGTLDPETLDQTLDTLERLQSESSKTIGIISHVDSLKDRIGTQIQLQRNGQGYSTLKIV